MQNYLNRLVGEQCYGVPLKVRLEPSGVSKGSVAELFDPSIHLLEPLIQEILLIMNLEDLLTERR